jgi:hypothetical protein
MDINFKTLKLVEVQHLGLIKIKIKIKIKIIIIELNFLIPESSNHHRCHHLV